MPYQMTAMEREEDQLDRDLAEGRITPEEHRREVNELRRAYRIEALEAARDAYEDELDRW